MKNSHHGQNLIIKGSKLISINPYQAKKFLQSGLQINPGEGIGWFNLGLAFHQVKNIKASIKSYKQALICGNAPKTTILNNLAQDLLLNGEFQEGWKLYENRHERMTETFKIYRQMYGPSWEGFNDKRKCEHLILIAEQGYGDTIQFCRLILSLNQRGIETSFFCQEALANFLRNASNIGNITTTIRPNQSQKHLWCPLMSLPRHLGIDNTNIPFQSGYLTTLNEDVQKWKQKLQRDPCKRLVALHWQGNPKFEERLYSCGRSMDPINWKLLKDIKGIEFVSLQKSTEKNKIIYHEELSFVKGQNLFDETLNFSDTAAVISNCDLVISTDSSVVHLSGALNIPTWVLLSWVPEWRWGLEKVKTEWYKNTTLYRQTHAGDWVGVMKRVASDLSCLPNLKVK